MPVLTPELLRLLEAIGKPFQKMAGNDAAFALGRGDKLMEGEPNTLSNIARKYSLPGRELRIRAAGPDADYPLNGMGDADPGDMYRIDMPNTPRRMDKSGRLVGSPHMDVIRNYSYSPFADDMTLPPKYDIDAQTASSKLPKGKGSAMQLYPAAWDLIKANEGEDMSLTLTPDNFIRKPAALMSHILRGNEAPHVPFTGEMFQGMDTDTYPQARDLAYQLMQRTHGGDPRAYALQLDAPQNIKDSSAMMTPDQRVGALALAEAAKVRQRMGGMRQSVQEDWHNAQWPADNGAGRTFNNMFSPFAGKDTLRYLGETHKVGDPTIRRALMSDWLLRRHLSGADLTEDTLPELDTNQAQRFGQNMFYAEGGLAQCHRCQAAEAEGFADGGPVGGRGSTSSAPPYRPVIGVSNAFSHDYRPLSQRQDPPVNMHLADAAIALATHPDPVVRRLAQLVMPHATPLDDGPVVQPRQAVPAPQRQPLPGVKVKTMLDEDRYQEQPGPDERFDDLEAQGFDQDLVDALRDLEMMKQ